jgi:hypothetical protein
MLIMCEGMQSGDFAHTLAEVIHLSRIVKGIEGFEIELTADMRPLLEGNLIFIFVDKVAITYPVMISVSPGNSRLLIPPLKSIISVIAFTCSGISVLNPERPELGRAD